jgi:Tfp pilus assembly protein PilF
MFFSRAIACAIVTCLVSTLTGCGASNGFMHNAQGTRNFKNGNYAEARRYFQMASADRPQKSDYLHNLASAMWKQGDPAGAEQVYRQTLDIDPMHQPSYHSLAKLMNEQGRVGEAQNLMTAWADTQPYIPEPQIELAWLNRETGNQAASEENLRQALQIDPSNSTALAHLGQVYQDQGRSGEAVAMYRRSLYQNWYQPDVKSRVATLDGSANPQTFASPATQFAQTPTFVNGQPMIVQNPVPTFANYPPAQSAVAFGQPVQSQPKFDRAQPIVMHQAQPSLAGVGNSDPAHADDHRLSVLPTVTAH